MNARKIVRAWKDEAYRLSLSDEERALLPDHPAGPIDLSDGELAEVQGAAIRATGGAYTLVPLCGPAPRFTVTAGCKPLTEV